MRRAAAQVACLCAVLEGCGGGGARCKPVSKPRVTKLIFANQHGPQVLLHTREGAHWRVEIQPAVDIREMRRDLSSKLAEVKRVFEKYALYECDCAGDFDMFGDWYAKRHDENCCRKGVPANEDDDSRVFDCDRDLETRYESRQEKLERLTDFIECFKGPFTTRSVFPLTLGYALDSCIHDNV